MDLVVLDTNQEPFAVLDTYNSFIWTDRYNECGDFEIYTKMSSDILDFIKQDYFLEQRGSDRTMIIEKLLIESDSEEGDNLTVTGRSLESILDRRIIWGQKTLSGNFQEGIETLLNENVISPENENRKIPNFVFEKSEDPKITELTIEAQYTGDNLYDVITSLCSEKDIGFSIKRNDEKQFVFRLYTGEDRTYDQTKNPYVIFSPKFDNLISSNYVESKSSFKNVTLIGGEETNETARIYTEVGNVSGLNRREIFTDASSVSKTVDEVTMSDSEYIQQLRQKGKETLSSDENSAVQSFEGEADTSTMFVYGVDFYGGDIVQVEDSYGHDARARIMEVVTSDGPEGCTVYPTFSIFPEDKLPEGYLRLTYIQSSGTQYFDTGFKPNNNTRVIMDVEAMDYSVASFFGSLNDYSASISSETSFKTIFGTSSLDVSANDVLQKMTIDKNKNICYFGDYGITNEDSVFQSEFSLFIFCDNSQGVPSESKISAKLYSCKIYDNEILSRNFVPVKNDKDVIGLYDFVEEKFYENSGTGEFIIET